MAKNNVMDRLRRALDLGELREEVEALIQAGCNQGQIYIWLDNYRAQSRIEGRDEDEDRIMEVMDDVAGWCSPNSRLFETYLSEDEIEKSRLREDMS